MRQAFESSIDLYQAGASGARAQFTAAALSRLAVTTAANTSPSWSTARQR
jgi:hypothetical protein